LQTRPSVTPFFLQRYPKLDKGGIPKLLPETVFQRDGVEHQALQLLLHFPQFQQAKSSPPVFQQDGDRLALKSNGKTIAWVKAELFPYWWLFKNLRSTGINKRSVIDISKNYQSSPLTKSPGSLLT